MENDSVHVLPSGEARRENHRQCRRELLALLQGETDEIALMASIAALLIRSMPQASFVGFYRVVEPGLLVIGPYQGPVGCLRIPFDRGVCGAAARRARSILVPDVQAFPGHIACDASAASELVVPVFNPAGELIAVLDCDSRLPAAFDLTDQVELEATLRMVFGGTSARGGEKRED